MNKIHPWKEEGDRCSSRIIVMSKRVKLHAVPSDVGELTELGAVDKVVAILIPCLNRSSDHFLQCPLLQIGFVYIAKICWAAYIRFVICACIV